MTTKIEVLAAQLKARRAARVAAGDPIAIRMQDASDRAQAERRERDRLERERLLRLLKPEGPGRPKQTARQKRAAQVRAAKALIAEIEGLKITTFAQAFRDYAKVHRIKPPSVKRRYQRALTTTTKGD
jgi:hypothetical protein